MIEIRVDHATPLKELTGIRSLIDGLIGFKSDSISEPAFVQAPVLAPPVMQQSAATPQYTPAAAPAIPLSQSQASAAPAASFVPTAAPQTFTVEQLAAAASALVDAGRVGELQALLAKYGVPGLPQLPPDQLGAFATDLRAMGAKI